ncbi:unnamed protein product [Spirodela intermedia]|uniref:C2H2-type domain-containing protein n=1 Tax=Spirodela intermedia TaxID=51605 RepID=A0ABN7E7U9_SPIIN|nr:unnamed protein product [Spirodela intermedia]
MQSRVESHKPMPGFNPPPAKKKRNLPGTPDPEAEVIALSPKTLLATNRFLCEICVASQGHNLPWKLKQRSTKEPRKRVYVCPEKSCVHHHPSRALGDLTGIKKHFCRKHGEKKWKCDKCSKRYAVQSDWKAHMKTCGTREYRAIVARSSPGMRDSFITHRAFCDALAEETARLCAASSSVSCVTTAANGGAVSCQLPGGSMRSSLHLLPTTSDMKETAISHHLLASVPSLYSTQHQQPSAPPPDMSATALLQKAAQIGIAPIEPPFLWSLYSKSGGGGIQVEDSNKFENFSL